MALAKFGPNALEDLPESLLKDLKRWGLPLLVEHRQFSQGEWLTCKKKILSEIKLFDLKRRLPYHNSFHTRDVLNRIDLLAQAAQIKAEDHLLLRLAALFHDYIHGRKNSSDNIPKSYEYRSALAADKFLKAKGFSLVQRTIVAALIRSTTFNHPDIVPRTHLEKLLVSADLGGFLQPASIWIQESVNVTLELPPSKRPKNLQAWIKNQQIFLMSTQKKLPSLVRSLGWLKELRHKKVLLKNLSNSKKDDLELRNLRKLIITSLKF